MCESLFGTLEWKLGGGDVRAWGGHGIFLGAMGRFDEALARVEGYIRLDPLGPRSALSGVGSSTERGGTRPRSST